MDQSVTTAEQRIRQTIGEQIPWDNPVYARTDGRSPMMKFMFDCYDLAKEHLAAHPADDAEPIDELFLRTIGFYDYPYRMALLPQNGMETRLHLMSSGDYWVATIVQAGMADVPLDESEFDDQDRVMFKLTTRRQLRDLLAAMGK